MLENEVVQLLIQKNYHIAFCESCTGGLCCGTLVNVSDASKVLNESIVTYANEAKIKYLQVHADTIEKYGVVSEQVVREMVIGICNQSQSEVGVSVSGIAGPKGGSVEKPVGMVCFGIKILDDIYTYTKYFGNIGRNEVRAQSVNFVFETLYELLKYE